MALATGHVSFFISQHAIERFRTRFAPGLRLSQCLSELKIIAAQAHRLRERGPRGEVLYEASDGSGMILVMKGEACVTVLFGGEDVSESDPQDPDA